MAEFKTAEGLFVGLVVEQPKAKAEKPVAEEVVEEQPAEKKPRKKKAE